MLRTIDGKGINEHILIINFMVDTPSGAINCAMNIHKVKEVIEIERLSVLPKEYLPFIAVHDLRHTPIPIMPLDYVFNHEVKSIDIYKKGRILICELQGKTIGILVSSTGRIREFKNSDVAPPPDVLTELKTKFFNGVINNGGDYIYLLDIESILDSFHLSLDGEVQLEKETPIFSGKKILIVEDSSLYQKKIKMIFSKWGSDLTFANNGKEALEIIKGPGSGFDLIFSDVEMPIMNGIEMATKLKSSKRFRQIPIIFNSSLSNPMLIEEIKEKSLGGYIVKFDQDAIRNEILNALGSKMSLAG